MLATLAAASVPLTLTKEYSFVAVFDAGSSGTRVHIYRPLNPGIGFSAVGALPDFAPNPSSKKVKPGLSSFVGKEDEVSTYLAPLLELISQSTKNGPVQASGVSTLPSDSCLVIFGATAGLRSVPSAAPKLVEAARSAVTSSTPCTIGSFRVISGEEEGSYGWLTVQSLSKRLPGQSNAAAGYWGVLEMGGASMQVTAPLQPPSLNSAMTRFKVPFGSQSELLYAHSFLGYGLDSARRSYNSFFAQKLTPDSPMYATHHRYLFKSYQLMHSGIPTLAYCRVTRTKATASIAMHSMVSQEPQLVPATSTGASPPSKMRCFPLLNAARPPASLEESANLIFPT
jgi:guanosine-diphosphatase